MSRRTPRYTGKERDSESGNDYFGARYYASTGLIPVFRTEPDAILVFRRAYDAERGVEPHSGSVKKVLITSSRADHCKEQTRALRLAFSFWGLMLRADRILFLSGIAGERVVVPTLEPPQGPRPVLGDPGAAQGWGTHFCGGLDW